MSAHPDHLRRTVEITKARGVTFRRTTWVVSKARTVSSSVDTHKRFPRRGRQSKAGGSGWCDHAFVADFVVASLWSRWPREISPAREIEARSGRWHRSYGRPSGIGPMRTMSRASCRGSESGRPPYTPRRRQVDTIDAEVAARSLLAGQSTAIPKTADGAVEMIRHSLKITRDTAMKARTTAMNTLKQIIVQALPVCEKPSHDLTDHGLLTRCAGLRPGPIDTPIASAQAHPRWSLGPSVDGSRRGNRAARPAPERVSPHATDHRSELRGLRSAGRPNQRKSR